MNPSTEDTLNAIAEVNADTIYIFPNNKNIVLAANQARDLTEDKEIVVVPTKTISSGNHSSDQLPAGNERRRESGSHDGGCIHGEDRTGNIRSPRHQTG